MRSADVCPGPSSPISRKQAEIQASGEPPRPRASPTASATVVKRPALVPGDGAVPFCFETPDRVDTDGSAAISGRPDPRAPLAAAASPALMLSTAGMAVAAVAVAAGDIIGKYRSNRASGRSRSFRSASVREVAGSDESESQSSPRRGWPSPGEAADSHGRAQDIAEGTDDSMRLLKAELTMPKKRIGSVHSSYEVIG